MYQLHIRKSPNHGGAIVPQPCPTVVLHWWGNPSGQNPWGVVDWLCNPASQVSAHAVIWAGNVVKLLDYQLRSWANGHDWANNNTVTIECDPNDVVGTMATVVEYLADLVRQGVLAKDFKLTGHRDYYATQCPGAYYQWLPTIRANVASNLDGDTPAPAPAKPALPTNYPLPYPLPWGHYFGDIAGPEASHGGFYANERPWVKAIQQALVIQGFTPNGMADLTNGWCDGIWEQPTTDAAIRFQRAHRPNGTQFWGQIWDDDLATLKSLFH